MARVRSGDTKPEVAVRKVLYSLAYRYRLHRKDLPGTPDSAFSTGVLPTWDRRCSGWPCSWADFKRVLARPDQCCDERGLPKDQMARRMKTNRSQLDRLLNPENDSVTLATLQKAARAIRREVRLELV